MWYAKYTFIEMQKTVYAVIDIDDDCKFAFRPLQSTEIMCFVYIMSRSHGCIIICITKHYTLTRFFSIRNLNFEQSFDHINSLFFLHIVVKFRQYIRLGVYTFLRCHFKHLKIIV